MNYKKICYLTKYIKILFYFQALTRVTFSSPFTVISAFATMHFKTLPASLPIIQFESRFLILRYLLQQYPSPQCQFLYLSAQVALIKNHRLRSLNNRHLFLWRLGSSRSRRESIQFLVRAFFLICMATFLLCPHKKKREVGWGAM